MINGKSVFIAQASLCVAAIVVHFRFPKQGSTLEPEIATKSEMAAENVLF
jgi:hypothetical protein